MRVTVRVKPGASRPRIEEQADGTLVAWLKSPPIEGRANQELIERLAEKFGVPRSRVQIRAGTSGRIKVVEIGE